MELTSRQRSSLRSAARRLRPEINVGKGGISPAVLAHLGRVFRQRELIKVRLLESAGRDRRATARALAAGAEATLVDVIGRIVVLYRPNETLPPEKRIPLPP